MRIVKFVTHVYLTLFRSLYDRLLNNRSCGAVFYQFHSHNRNTFCGTWYLPHSQVHNDRTVLLWPDALCMHETAIFPLPLLNMTSPSCSSIRENLRQIGLYLFAWIFRALIGLNGNRGRCGAILTPMNLFLLLGVLTSVLILMKIVRVRTDGYTH